MKTAPVRQLIVGFMLMWTAAFLLPPVFAAAATDTSFIAFTSDPADWVGQGESRTFTSAGGRLLQSMAGASTFVTLFDGYDGTSRASLHLRAPSGQPLVPGAYENATRLDGDPSLPQLAFSYKSRTCGVVTGRFDVLEATFGPDNHILRFHATFEQHCEGSTAALYGEVQVVTPPPPANDDFDSATLISSVPFTDTTSTVEATAAPDDPTGCPTTESSVWYSFTPATTTHVYTDIGTGGFHVVGIFSGARGSLSKVGCGNDVVQWRAEQGVTYHIMVAGVQSDLIFSLYQAFPAANDDFDDPALIDALPSSHTVPASNIRDSTSPEDDPDCYGAGRTVWYSLTMASTVGVEITTSGSTYDTALCVYFGTRGDLTEVVANNNESTDPSITTSRVRFVADAGVTYHVMVGSRFCCGGDLSLALVESPILPANDSLSIPTAIASIPFVDHVDTRTATASPYDPNVGACQGYRYTVWYALTPAETTPIVVDTVGSSYTTVMEVFTGTRGNLSTVICDLGVFHDDGQARVTFAAQAGVTYYLMVASNWFGAGDLTLNVNRALDLEISINSTGTLTRSGAAVVSGTISCSLDVPVDLDGTVRQERLSGSESGVISTHGFACNSPSTPWSATVTPNDRRFMTGSATVYVQLGGCGPNNCDFATMETELQLRRR
jgi:hypothetical protein